MKNKLAYLGFLGLLGFAGFFGASLLFAFFAFFGFFWYNKVVPDELFWNNVRTCATRGFFIFLIMSSILLASTVLMIANDLDTYAITLIRRGFGVMVAVCIFVFSAGLAYIEWKEKPDGD